MTPIKLLLVDDEPIAHKVLEGYCHKLDSVTVVGNCYDGISTLNFVTKHQVDAILLDIQMPDFTGLEVLNTLKNNAPKVILTTAYTEFAVQCFEYDQVVDYLHKPIRIDRFFKAVHRLQKRITLEQSEKKNATPPTPIKRDQDFISIRDNRTLYKIRLDQIICIQAWGNYLKIFLGDGSYKTVRKTIKEIILELPVQQFMQVHKSYIVNNQSVVALRGNELFLDNNLSLPVGKSYSMLVKNRLL